MNKNKTEERRGLREVIGSFLIRSCEKEQKEEGIKKEEKRK